MNYKTLESLILFFHCYRITILMMIYEGLNFVNYDILPKGGD